MLILNEYILRPVMRRNPSIIGLNKNKTKATPYLNTQISNIKLQKEIAHKHMPSKKLEVGMTRKMI